MSQPVSRWEMHLSASHGAAAAMLPNAQGDWVGYSDYAALAAENERFRKVLKCVEQAWYNQRSGDVIRLVDEALAWKEQK